MNSASASSNNTLMSGNMFVSVNIGNVPSSSHPSHPHSIMRSSSSSKNNRVPSATPPSTFTPPPPPHQLQQQLPQQHFSSASSAGSGGSRDAPQLDPQLISYGGGFNGGWPPGKGQQQQQPMAALPHDARDAAHRQGFHQNAQLQSMFRQENAFHSGVVAHQGVGDTDSVMSFRSSNSGSEVQNPRRLPSVPGGGGGVGATNGGAPNGMPMQPHHQMLQQHSMPTGFAGGASGSKVEMVYSLLSMLGTHDKEDMSRTLFSMSRY